MSTTTNRPPRSGWTRIAAGLYRSSDGTVEIEYITKHHECADVVDFVPCWRALDMTTWHGDVIGHFDTLGAAQAATR